jgi:hypothetical protein
MKNVSFFVRQNLGIFVSAIWYHRRIKSTFDTIPKERLNFMKHAPTLTRFCKHSPQVRLILGLLLLTALCLLLISCTSARRDPDLTSPSADTTAIPESTLPPSESAEAPPLSFENSDMTAYYVSLIEELQEEIRILKAENFILSSRLSLESAEDETLAQDPLPFTYLLDDGEITILSYTGSAPHVMVPATIDGHPVTEIGERAFAGSKLQSIELPETVTEIEWFAFSDCTMLKSIRVGMALCEIGYGAFDGCPAALKLICPKNSYAEKYGKSFGLAVEAQ